MKKVQWLSGALLLLISGLSYADGPCPDGQFNPNNSVCMCPGGGYVAPNTYCNRGGGGNSAPQRYWSAIALDLPKGRATGYSWSTSNSREAEKEALETCRYSDCKVVLTYQNNCGAVAIELKGDILGKGVSSTRAEAERRAIANCTKNGGKQCTIWVKAKCAG